MPSCYAYLSNMIAFVMADECNKSPQCIIINRCLNRRISMQFLFGVVLQLFSYSFGELFPACYNVSQCRVIDIMLDSLPAIKKIWKRLLVRKSHDCAKRIAG